MLGSELAPAHLRLVAQEHDEALALVHAGRRALLVQHEDLALRALQRREEVEVEEGGREGG